MIGNLLLALGLTFAVGVSPLYAGVENPSNIYDGGYASLSSPISIETTLGNTLTNFVLNEDLYQNGSSLNLWAFHIGDEGQLSHEENYASESIGNMNIVNSYFNSHSDCVFIIWFIRSNNFYIIETFWRYYSYQNMTNNMLVFDFRTVNYNLDNINVYTGYNNFGNCKIGSISSDHQYVYRPYNSLSDFQPNYDAQSYIGGGLTFQIDGSPTQTGGYFDFNCCVAFEKESDYTQGYNTGFTDGYQAGEKDGESSGYSNGYNQGYQDGLTITSYSDLGKLFGVIADTPIMLLRSIFSFDLFGMNVFVAIMSLLTGLVVLYIVRKIL